MHNCRVPVSYANGLRRANGHMSFWIRPLSRVDNYWTFGPVDYITMCYMTNLTLVPQPPANCSDIGYTYTFIADRTLADNDTSTDFFISCNWSDSAIEFLSSTRIFYAIAVKNGSTIVEYNLKELGSGQLGSSTVSRVERIS